MIGRPPTRPLAIDELFEVALVVFMRVRWRLFAIEFVGSVFAVFVQLLLEAKVTPLPGSGAPEATAFHVATMPNGAPNPAALATFIAANLRWAWVIPVALFVHVLVAVIAQRLAAGAYLGEVPPPARFGQGVLRRLLPTFGAVCVASFGVAAAMMLVFAVAMLSTVLVYALNQGLAAIVFLLWALLAIAAIPPTAIALQLLQASYGIDAPAGLAGVRWSFRAAFTREAILRTYLFCGFQFGIALLFLIIQGLAVFGAGALLGKAGGGAVEVVVAAIGSAILTSLIVVYYVDERLRFPSERAFSPSEPPVTDI